MLSIAFVYFDSDVSRAIGEKLKPAFLIQLGKLIVNVWVGVTVFSYPTHILLTFYHLTDWSCENV